MTMQNSSWLASTKPLIALNVIRFKPTTERNTRSSKEFSTAIAPAVIRIRITTSLGKTAGSATVKNPFRLCRA